MEKTKKSKNMFQHYAFLNWTDCLDARAKLRKDLALEPNLEEDKKTCRILYSLYLNNMVL